MFSFEHTPVSSSRAPLQNNLILNPDSSVESQNLPLDTQKVAFKGNFGNVTQNGLKTIKAFCQICKLEPVEPIESCCGHRYCLFCIFEHLNFANRCPAQYCREIISLNLLVRPDFAENYWNRGEQNSRCKEKGIKRTPFEEQRRLELKKWKEDTFVLAPYRDTWIDFLRPDNVWDSGVIMNECLIDSLRNERLLTLETLTGEVHRVIHWPYACTITKPGKKTKAWNAQTSIQSNEQLSNVSVNIKKSINDQNYSVPVEKKAEDRYVSIAQFSS